MMGFWIGMLIGGLVLTVACLGIYLALSLPLRRQEQARFFLDLLETGLNQGKRSEPTLISIAQSGESSVGVWFHLLAGYLEQGLRLVDALDKVPALLPPPVVAMLKTGQKIGDIAQVLPACRRYLSEGSSRLQSAVNYVVVLMVVVTPVVPLVIGSLVVFVFPKFMELLKDMEISLPPLFQTVVEFSRWGWMPMAGLVVALYFLAFLYAGGPRVSTRLARIWAPGIDQLVLRLPWRRQRLLRDFSAMLAVLLDAAVPESEAVTMAADCTANSVFQERARRVVADLRQGRKLTDALEHFDELGELRWRLANANRAKSGFLRALSGWHEALDARAFQWEQTAAQGVTTMLVVLNGVVVGTMAIAVFQVLCAIINEGVLW